MTLHPAIAPIRTTCPYCGVGCGVLASPDGRGGATIDGDPAHPANNGRLCIKGAAFGQTLGHQGRLLAPQIGRADGQLGSGAGSGRGPVSRHHRPARAGRGGLLLRGELLTEDYYVFNKLAKGLIGTDNIDTNSRLCMSSAVAGYKATLGADAPPACYDDLAHAQCLFIAGSNPAWAHPIGFRRIEDARAANPATRSSWPIRAAPTRGHGDCPAPAAGQRR